MAPILCEYSESFDHDVHTYPYRNYVHATCASVENKLNELIDKTVETMKERIIENSQCFNQSRENYSELDFSLGSPNSKVSLYDDFDPSYLARPNLHDNMPFLILKQESDLAMSLSANLAPYTSSHKDVTKDVLVFVDPPTTLDDFYEF